MSIYWCFKNNCKTFYISFSPVAPTIDFSNIKTDGSCYIKRLLCAWILMNRLIVLKFLNRLIFNALV